MDAGKVFNDPVHGHISLSSDAISLINTKQFQRLRYVFSFTLAYLKNKERTNNNMLYMIIAEKLNKLDLESMYFRKQNIRDSHTHLEQHTLHGTLEDGLCHG